MIGQQIYILTLDQIKVLAKEVAEEIHNTEKPMTRKEACEYLGWISGETLRKKMNDPINPIPFHGGSKSALFFTSEINEWIKSTGKPSLLRRIK